MRGTGGWVLATAAAASNFVTFGVLFSFGLFLTPLSETFGASTAAVASIFSGSVFCYYLAGALGGMLGDRWGARPVVAFGAIALPLGLVGAAASDQLWQLFALYVPLVGLAVGSCYSPLIGAVGRTMPNRRALAIAVVLTGVGGGTLAMPLVIRALLDRFGWRDTFRVLGLVAALVLIVTAALAASDGGRTGGGPSGVVKSMLRSRPFRRLYLSVVLIAPGFYAPLAFLNDYAVDQGIQTGLAAVLVATIGLGSVASRIGFGATAQRFGPMRQYRFSHMLFLTALSCWAIADWFPSAPFLVLAAGAALHGLGWAAWVTAAPLVLADWFGVDDLGLSVGGFYTGLGVGALIGPPVTGAVIDAVGYREALMVVLVTTAASLAVLLVPARAAGWRGGQAAVRPRR